MLNAPNKPACWVRGRKMLKLAEFWPKNSLHFYDWIITFNIGQPHINVVKNYSIRPIQSLNNNLLFCCLQVDLAHLLAARDQELRALSAEVIPLQLPSYFDHERTINYKENKQISVT